MSTEPDFRGTGVCCTTGNICVCLPAITCVDVMGKACP